MKIKRNGFTIVEMLMVIGVLAVLTAIVTTAASSAVRQARTRRIEAMRMMVQTGIATYRAQRGHWPPKGGKLDKWSDDGLEKQGEHVAYLGDEEYDKTMTFLVKECVDKSKSPIMDVSGLSVATRSAANAGGHGQDFRSAVAKNKRHGATLKVSEMVFGYSAAEDHAVPDWGQDRGKLAEKAGRFYRFIVKYNADSDSITVMTQSSYADKTGKKWDPK